MIHHPINFHLLNVYPLRIQYLFFSNIVGITVSPLIILGTLSLFSYKKKMKNEEGREN